jgi:hypothetical protein
MGADRPRHPAAARELTEKETAVRRRREAEHEPAPGPEPGDGAAPPAKSGPGWGEHLTTLGATLGSTLGPTLVENVVDLVRELLARRRQPDPATVEKLEAVLRQAQAVAARELEEAKREVAFLRDRLVAAEEAQRELRQILADAVGSRQQ